MHFRLRVAYEQGFSLCLSKSETCRAGKCAEPAEEALARATRCGQRR